MKPLSLFFGILLLSFCFRFFSLSSLPNGLYWDEYDSGYQAYSLLKTGRDYFGNLLPVFPHSLSDFRTPVNLYLLTPIINYFGLTAFSVRLPSVIFGVLSVFLIYYLCRMLFNNHFLALLSSLTLSFSPWHFLFSRTALDGITCMLFFFLLGLILYLKNSIKFSALFFSLALYSYSPAKLFIPLFVLSLIFIYRLAFRQLIFFLVCLAVLSAPLYLDSLFGASSTRFHDISVFTDPTLSDQVDLSRFNHQIAMGSRGDVGLSPSVYDKIISNKLLTVIQTLAVNYFKSLSPEYLFIYGDEQLRHSPSLTSIGQFQLLDLAPFILGLAILFTKLSSTKPGQLLIAWLVISPLPSALTRDGGAHAGRTFFVLPVVSILIALGLIHFKKLVFLTYLTLSLVSYLFIYDYFFTYYRVESAAAFNYGFSHILQVAADASSRYDRVIVDTHKENALMAYLFQTQFPPREFSRMLPFKLHTVVADVPSVNISNLYFVTPGDRHWTDFLPKMTGNDLLITAADQPLADQLPIKSVYVYPDRSPAYYFVPVSR